MPITASSIIQGWRSRGEGNPSRLFHRPSERGEGICSKPGVRRETRQSGLLVVLAAECRVRCRAPLRSWVLACAAPERKRDGAACYV